MWGSCRAYAGARKYWHSAYKVTTASERFGAQASGSMKGGSTTGFLISYLNGRLAFIVASSTRPANSTPKMQKVHVSSFGSSYLGIQQLQCASKKLGACWLASYVQTRTCCTTGHHHHLWHHKQSNQSVPDVLQNVNPKPQTIDPKGETIILSSKPQIKATDTTSPIQCCQRCNPASQAIGASQPQLWQSYQILE